MDPNCVTGIKDRILVLAGSVDDVAVVLLVLVPDRLVEDIFDGGVVRVDKGVFDVPDREGGLA